MNILELKSIDLGTHPVGQGTKEMIAVGRIETLVKASFIYISPRYYK